MIDKEELRRLAKAITDEQEPGEFSASFIHRRHMAIAFEDAANPATIIELLDEIERLRAVFDAASAVLRYPNGVDAVPYQRMQTLARAVQAALLTEPGG